MAILIASGIGVSVSANSKSNDLVSGTYQFIGPGKITLVAKASATGLYNTLNVGGISLSNDLPVVFTGTAGTMSVNDNVVVSQFVSGGRVELFFRNTTGSAITVDYMLLYEPGRR